MLIDGADLAAGHELQADVCVLGAGAAGITIATTLMGSGLSVLLCEGGRFEPDPASSALYRGEVTGLPFRTGEPEDLEAVRVRAFGGTTGQWAGVCRPLQPLDFTSRPWVAPTGWPIGLDDLAPHYDAAVALIGLADTSFDAGEWEARWDLAPLPVAGDRLVAATHQVHPQRFGTAYRDRLVGAPDVTVVIDATATHLAVEPEGDRVNGVELSTLAGTRFRASAAVVVLALGGIENPRLLLASDDVRTRGIGNEDDLVGRYFTEHVSTLGGFALLDGPPNANAAFGRRMVEVDGREVAMTTAPALTDAIVVEEELVAAGSQPVVAPYPEDAPAQEGGATAAGVAALTAATAGVVPGTMASLLVAAEQRLDPESRVTLGAEADPLGVRRVAVDWRQDEVEARSIARFLQVFGEELGRRGRGRLQVAMGQLDPSHNEIGSEVAADYRVDPGADGSGLVLEPGNHHMCTTRMADAASAGVVDRDCRVHGTANLYVAGSSVFATGGLAPPTFTIVALAHRLAGHLRGVRGR